MLTLCRGHELYFLMHSLVGGGHKEPHGQRQYNVTHVLHFWFSVASQMSEVSSGK